MIQGPIIGAGSVSDLRLDLAGEDVSAQWSTSCLQADVDYALYEGSLGDFTSHVPLTCTNGGATSATFGLPPGNAYYLVVPTNGRFDGSHGRDGDGDERSTGPSPCRVQATDDCS